MSECQHDLVERGRCFFCLSAEIATLRVALAAAQSEVEAWKTLALRPEELPTSIRGLDPDFTGGVTSSQYVKRGWSANG